MKRYATLILSFFIFTSCNIKANEYFKIAKEKIAEYRPIRRDYVIILDYRKSIMSTRLYVIDLKKEEIIISSNVSHAWNSGAMYATNFSNTSGSNKSSYGVFKTGSSCFGAFGYSMIVNGLDHGINNNARPRSIIFHSTEKMMTLWSNGCFATSSSINKKIIDLTKNGCLVVVLK